MFDGLFQSRRFWIAVAGVLAVVAGQLGLPVSEEQVQHIVLIVAAWILGDSMRQTTPKRRPLR